MKSIPKLATFSPLLIFPIFCSPFEAKIMRNNSGGKAKKSKDRQNGRENHNEYFNPIDV